MKNKELLKKGLVQSSDLSGGGKLQDEQANRFLDYVYDESIMQSLGIRTERFKGDKKKWPKVSISGRALYAHTEGSDATIQAGTQIRRGVTTSEFTVEWKKMVVPWEITEEMLWSNVEGVPFEEHVMQMLAKQAQNDIEQLMFEADTLGHAIVENDLAGVGDTAKVVLDNVMNGSDGWLKDARTSHEVSAEAAPISLSFFSAMYKEMPNKFKRNKKDLVWLCPPEIEQDYRMLVSARAGQMGERAAEGIEAMRPFGIPLIPVPLFPVNPRVTEHFTFSGAGGVKTLLYKNIVTDSEIVVYSSLADTATTKFVKDTDFTMDYVNGTITHITSGGGGNINEATEIKITYKVPPQIILTKPRNLVWVASQELKLKRSDHQVVEDKVIFAMHGRFGVGMEETDMTVLGKNLKEREL